MSGYRLSRIVFLRHVPTSPKIGCLPEGECPWCQVIGVTSDPSEQRFQGWCWIGARL